ALLVPAAVQRLPRQTVATTGDASSVDGVHDGLRRHRVRIVAAGVPVEIVTRQRVGGDALMGSVHVLAEDRGWQIAARSAVGRRVVVIADPDAGDEMRRVADEPGVAELLAGA